MPSGASHSFLSRDQVARLPIRALKLRLTTGKSVLLLQQLDSNVRCWRKSCFTERPLQCRNARVARVTSDIGKGKARDRKKNDRQP